MSIENKKYVAECMDIVRDTIGTLLEDSSESEERDFLNHVKHYIQDLLNSTVEDGDFDEGAEEDD